MTPSWQGNKKCGDQTGFSFSAFCLMNTKLTGNEFYVYKIEAQQCSFLNGFTSNPRHDTSVLLEGISIHKVQC